MTALTNPIAHARDPQSSRHAAVAVTASGQRWTHAQVVLAALQQGWPWTAHELGEYTGLGRVEAARRLTDLQAAGLVRRGDAARARRAAAEIVLTEMGY